MGCKWLRPIRPKISAHFRNFLGRMHGVIFILSFLGIVLKSKSQYVENQNLYLFVNIFIFTILYIVVCRELSIFQVQKKWKLVILGAYSVVYTFPSFYLMPFLKTYYETNPKFFEIDQREKIDLVKGLSTNVLDSNFPYKNLLLLVSVLIVLIIALKTNSLLKSGLISIAGLIYLVTNYFYASFASPYSFVPTLEQPQTNRYLYAVSHFKNGEGIVNADEFVHSAVTDLFLKGSENDLMLIRRPLTYFLVSGPSQYLNSFYIWILLNFVTFLVFILSIMYMSKIFRFNNVIMFFFIITITLSPILYVYSSQTSGYFASIVAPWIFFALTLKKFNQKGGKLTFLDIAPSASILMLVYDLSPWLLAILAFFVVAQKALSSMDAIKISIAAIAFNFFFQKITILFFGLSFDNANEIQLISATKNIYSKVLNPTLSDFPNQTLLLAKGIVTNFSRLSINLPLILIAIIALLLFLTSKQVQLLTICFISACVLVQTFWFIGDMTNVGFIPRIIAPVFVLSPLIYFGFLQNYFARKVHFQTLFSLFLLFPSILFITRYDGDWLVKVFYLVEGMWMPYGW